jgi:hypothetical protein
VDELIIYDEQVLKGMKDEAKRVSLPVKIKEPLLKTHTLFSKLNVAMEDDSLLSVATEAEGKMNRILLESLQVHSLFDPSKFGYDHVIEDSIRYLFVPKGQQVGDYVVDIITVFFKCTRENSEINVNLPFYLVTVNEKEFIVLMETDTDQVVSIENLSFF